MEFIKRDIKKQNRNGELSPTTISYISSIGGSNEVGGNYLPAIDNGDGTYTVDLTQVTFNGNLLATGEVTAYKSGESGGGGGGSVTVYDGLDSTSKTIALSANQGRILKGLIDNIGDVDLTGYYNKTEIENLISGYSKTNHIHSISDVTDLQNTLDNKSDTTHTHTNYLTKGSWLNQSDVNFDNLTSSAFYAYASGNGTGNTNNPNGYGLMSVFGSNNGYAAQFAISAENVVTVRTKYHRTKDGVIGVFWNNWTELATKTSVDNLSTQLTNLTKNSNYYVLSGNSTATDNTVRFMLYNNGNTRVGLGYAADSLFLTNYVSKKSLTIDNKLYFNNNEVLDLGNYTTYVPTLANFNNHTGDTTKHITAAERTNWNDANSKKHSHSNKTVLDGITSAKVSNWDTVYNNWNKAFAFDTNGNLKVKVNVIGEKEISAWGAGTSTGGGSVDIVDALTSTRSDAALSANQGKVLKGLIDNIDFSGYYNKTEVDDKLKGYHRGVVTYTNESNAGDSTTAPEFLGYATGLPSKFHWIETKFYQEQTAEKNRMQIAYGYDDNYMAYRRFKDGSWKDWKQVAFVDDVDNGLAEKAPLLHTHSEYYTITNANNTFLPFTGGTLTGHLTIKSTTASAYKKLVVGDPDGYNAAFHNSSYTGSNREASISWMNGTTTVGSIGVGTYPFYHNGTHNFELLHIGNYAGYALPLTGGALTGSLVTNAVVPGADNTYSLGFSNYRWAIGHFANLSVSSDDVCPLIVNRTHTRLPYIGFALNGKNGGYIGGTADGNMFMQTGLGSETTYSVLKLYREGKIELQTPSANYDVYTSKNLNIDKFIYAPNTTTTGTSEETGKSSTLTRTTFWRDNNISSIGLTVLHSERSTYGWQIRQKYSEDALYVKRKYNDVWQTEKEIAFTTSNVASATKLETPRSLWGQSFNGSADVVGSIFMNNDNAIVSKDTSGTDRVLLHFNTNNAFSIGYGTSGAGYATYIDGSTIYLRYGTAHNTGIVLNSAGNVTIGSSNKALTNCKLYIEGITNSTNNIVVQGSTENVRYIKVGNTLSSTSLYVGTTGNRGLYDSTVNKWICYSNGTNTNLNLGNVGVGNTDPRYKLDVSGSIGGNSVNIYGSEVTDNSKALKFLASDKSSRALMYYKGNTTDGLLCIESLYSDIAIITNTGKNVGIGTTTPLYKLHVDGTMYGDLKMKTPRTLWGQSFDGTANVSGNINLNGAVIKDTIGGTILGYSTDSNTISGAISTGCNFVGSPSTATVIRSNGTLKHYRGDDKKTHLILDSANTEYLGSYSIDASALSTSNFYPIVFAQSAKPLVVRMYSLGGNSSAAYNRNDLEFTFRGQGWTDAPQNLTVHHYNCYSATETTIGCIGMGQEGGAKVVWVRGGVKYAVFSNIAPSLKTANYTDGNQIFTVGTSFSGGTNTKVGIFWTPQTTSGLGTLYHSSGLAVGSTLGVNGNAAIKGTLTTDGLATFSGNITTPLATTDTVLTTNIGFRGQFAANLSKVGWYRFATSRNANNIGGTYIFTIRRAYNNTINETYTLLANVDFGGCNWTQLGGNAQAQLITKVRCTYDNNGSMYFDFYYNGTATNAVTINCIGDAYGQIPTLVTSALAATNETSLTNGFKTGTKNAYQMTIYRNATNGGSYIMYGANNQLTKTWAAGSDGQLRFGWYYKDTSAGTDVEKMWLDSAGNLSSDYWYLNNTVSNPYLKLTHTYSGTTYTNYLQGYNGYLYLGAGSAKSLRIDSSGNCLSVGEVTAHSDKRLKSNIKPLSVRGELNPVTYTKDGKESIGFIADEVKEIYPELVITDDSTEDKYLSLNYAQLTAVLYAEIKELKKRITQLENK